MKKRKMEINDTESDINFLNSYSSRKTLVVCHPSPWIELVSMLRSK